jgi:hypothetical protein
VCAVGEWGVRITGMARDTTWQEVKNMLLRYADVQHHALVSTSYCCCTCLLYLHAKASASNYDYHMCSMTLYSNAVLYCHYNI